MRSNYLNISNKNNVITFNFCQTPIVTENQLPIYKLTKEYVIPHAYISELRDMCLAIMISKEACNSVDQWIFHAEESGLIIILRIYVCHTENDLYGMTIAIGPLDTKSNTEVNLENEFSSTFVTGGLTKEDFWHVITSLSLPLKHNVVSTSIENMETTIIGLTEEECPMLLGLVTSEDKNDIIDNSTKS